MSASVAIDDSIRRLRSSGRSIREIKRLLSCSQARITKALATPEGVSVCRRGRPTKLTPVGRNSPRNNRSSRSLVPGEVSNLPQCWWQIDQSVSFIPQDTAAGRACRKLLFRGRWHRNPWARQRTRAKMDDDRENACRSRSQSKRTRREAPLSLLEWDREHGQEAWDARITGNRPFSITKLDLLKIPEIRVHFTSLFQTGGNTIKKLLGHSPLKCTLFSGTSFYILYNLGKALWKRAYLERLI